MQMTGVLDVKKAVLVPVRAFSCKSFCGTLALFSAEASNLWSWFNCKGFLALPWVQGVLGRRPSSLPARLLNIQKSPIGSLCGGERCFRGYWAQNYMARDSVLCKNWYVTSGGRKKISGHAHKTRLWYLFGKEFDENLRSICTGIPSELIPAIRRSFSGASLRFGNHKYDYRLNWTTRCPVTS